MLTKSYTKEYHFNPTNTHHINIIFPCLYCRHKVISGMVFLPAPNFAAKSTEESYNHEDYDFECESCKEQYYITTYVGFDDAFIRIDDFDKKTKVQIEQSSEKDFEEEYLQNYLEEIVDNRHLFQSFQTNIKNLKKLNTVNLNDTQLNSLLKCQIYAGLITLMETFLSDTFIKLTLADDEKIRKFVKSFPEFRQRKFELNNIFEEYKSLNSLIRSTLQNIMYHNLPKVREMYKNTLNIDFPDIGEASKCVFIRHDIIHRNGKTKDGKLLGITKQVVNKAIKVIETFVSGIAGKLNLG